MSVELLLAAGGSSAPNIYVDDVFNITTYVGNGGQQTISNGIDLTGKGGMVWSKSRATSGYYHELYDTTRGNGSRLYSNTSDFNSFIGNSGIDIFYGNGYRIGSGSNNINKSSDSVVSWTFRKEKKFFDIVTWTGNGIAGRVISHALTVKPGIIIVKRTSGSESGGAAGYWFVYHRGLVSPQSACLFLNTTDARNSTGTWNNTQPTESGFSIGSSYVNSVGDSYVAYVFAHDEAADGLIQCGSFSTDNSGTVPVVLGWEPQYVLYKKVDAAGDWQVYDCMRGMDLPNPGARLCANNATAESLGFYAKPNANGFTYQGEPNCTHVFMAIRRSNKPPTSGNQVYNGIARTGTGATDVITGAGFAPDLLLTMPKGGYSGLPCASYDRLRGANKKLLLTGDAESGVNDQVTSFGNDGVSVGADELGNINTLHITYINWLFRRAAGVFDVVCYAGSGANKTINHNLGAVPQLMFVKSRNGTTQWAAFSDISLSNYWNGYLNSSAAGDRGNSWSGYFDGNPPTDKKFVIGGWSGFNSINTDYIMYLFSTKGGVSKVGAYAGNGGAMVINCGFSSGARFILIKRTDALGDWYVWDSVRGIVAGQDPHLSLNTTAFEVINDDSVDPDPTGFIVNQVAATNINVGGATYIYLAIA